MANELATFDLNQLPSVSMGNDASYADLTAGAEFLKYVKLYTKGKPIDTGKIRPGHWGIPDGDDEIIDLGESIDVLPLARRPKAVDTSDKSAVIVSYDEASDAFKGVQARSLEKDSGCQWGVSFLCYERSTRQFIEVFLGNKSSRPEAKNLFPCLPVTQGMLDACAAAGGDVSDMEPHGPIPITLTARLAENKRGQSWHVPKVTKCSAPIPLPKMEAISKAIQKFLTVKTEGTEKVKDERKQRAR